MKSNEQGEYCRSGSAVIRSLLGRFAKNRYINYLLYFSLLFQVISRSSVEKVGFGVLSGFIAGYMMAVKY